MLRKCPEIFDFCFVVPKAFPQNYRPIPARFPCKKSKRNSLTTFCRVRTLVTCSLSTGHLHWPLAVGRLGASLRFYVHAIMFGIYSWAGLGGGGGNGKAPEYGKARDVPSVPKPLQHRIFGQLIRGAAA